MSIYTALKTAQVVANNKRYTDPLKDETYTIPNYSTGLGQTFPTKGRPSNTYIPGIENTINPTDPHYKYTKSKSTRDKKALMQYLVAFGAPPMFRPEVDPMYPLIDKVREYNFGRVYGSTFLSNPTLLSLCPGSVTYLKSLGKETNNLLYNTVSSVLGDDTKSKMGKEDDSVDGNLFKFKPQYAEYISIVNLLCRSCAIMLGIGDLKSPWNGKKYKEVDYGYITSSKMYTTKDKNKVSIFSETEQAIYASVGANTDQFIHFFLTNQGTSLREDSSIQTSDSLLESTIGGDSQASQLMNNLAFFFGRDIGAGMNASADTSAMEADLKAVFNTGDSNTFFGGVTKLLKNYLKGGKLVIPKMIDQFSYDKSLSCTLKLPSIYGDKESIFLRCLVPISHLIAMQFPKQIAENMYTFPYVVRAFQRGWFSSDLAVITNLNITRGGQDDIGWTVDGLATEYEVSFDIVPLVQNIMVTSSHNPFLFLKNSALIDYLGCLCGVDTRADWNKVTIAMQMLLNKVKDLPSETEKYIGNWLGNAITPIFNTTAGRFLNPVVRAWKERNG